jgi:hypothetical protein
VDLARNRHGLIALELALNPQDGQPVQRQINFKDLQVEARTAHSMLLEFT